MCSWHQCMASGLHTGSFCCCLRDLGPREYGWSIADRAKMVKNRRGNTGTTTTSLFGYNIQGSITWRISAGGRLKEHQNAEKDCIHTYRCVIVCVEVISMATNLQIDDKLITQATKLGGHRTKRAAVTQALTDYIHHLRQERILSLFGTLVYDPEYDHKKQRARA